MIRANDDRLRKILLGQQQVVQEVYEILDEEQRKDDVLRAVVLSWKGKAINHIPRLDPDRVFTVDEIRRTCITQRLRFLDAGYFKGPLPPQALYELRRLEARMDEPLKGFKIMAPARRFRLCDSDADPLLFVCVGPQQYYLVHKWGGDLAPWRTAVHWPLRGPWQLIATLLVAAGVAASLLPNWVIGQGDQSAWWGTQRLLAFIWTPLVLASFTVFSWFTFFGQFSANAWNDRHFN